MALKTKEILGINITISSSRKDLEEVWKYLKKVQSPKFKVQSERIKPLIIYTPNPEIIAYAQKNEEFKRLVNTGQINLPDGAGIVWAMKKLYGIKIEKIPGVDFMLKLVKMTAREGLRIGLIGGRGDLAVTTRECLLSKHQNLKIGVFDAPEIEISNIKYQKPVSSEVERSKIHIKNKKDKDTKDTPGVAGWNVSGSRDSPGVEESEERYFIDLANEIIKKKIDILFVALGHPKQEYFINELKKSFLDLASSTGKNLVKITNTSDRLHLLSRGIIFMGVGGAFDYISGRVPRAPSFIRNLGLEWLFRLIREPSRLPRQLTGAEFFYKILFS